MKSNKSKFECEEKILALQKEISDSSNKTSVEFKKLLQKIYTPIWQWLFYCFNEDDIRNAGIEIFHCIKRCILNYKKDDNNSFIAFLYSCLKSEIKYKKQRGELPPMRMCSRENYDKAHNLIKIAEQIGKNPNDENVQKWLAKQVNLTLEQVKELLIDYHQSQVVYDTKKTIAIYEDVSSIFETTEVKNPYLSPELELVLLESVNQDLQKIEEEFNSCQTRQKKYLSSFITLRIIKLLETRFSIDKISELIKFRSFIDSSLLEYMYNKMELPSQKELALKLGKDEGYISNRIKDFLKKFRKKYQLYKI